MTPAVFIIAVVGVGKLGGELPGKPVPACCWGVAVSAVGGCVEAACDPDAGKRGAEGPAVAWV